MAGELAVKLTTGLTLKALILGPVFSNRWDGSALVAISSVADADWATGMVAMTEQQTSDATGTTLYVGDFPAGITTPGEYLVVFYSGASPTPGQAGIGQQTVRWSGSAIVSVVSLPTITQFNSRTLASNQYATYATQLGMSTKLNTVIADLPGLPTKNVALSNFPFLMVLATDHVTGGVGLTVTAERSLDGGAFAACANAVVEVANGVYTIDLAASDMNADTVCLQFTASTADPHILTFVTQKT